MSETRTIKCPFCQQGEIQTHYTPKTLITRYSHASSNRSMMKYFKDEKYSIISSECPSCHKSKKEIEKFFKEGKSVSASDAAKRAKELGLPTKI